MLIIVNIQVVTSGEIITMHLNSDSDILSNKTCYILSYNPTNTSVFTYCCSFVFFFHSFFFRIMSKSIRTLTCCYKECQNDSPLDARIEVKTVLPKSISKTIKSQFLVLWRSNGEAEFHIDCWDKLYLLSRFQCLL